MENRLKKQIKTLLAQEDLSLKQLVEMLGEKQNKHYAPDNFSHKIRRKTVTFEEMLDIAEILGYKIKFEKIEE